MSPPDSVSDASFWRDASSFKLATNTFYYALPGPAGYDANSDIQYANGPDQISSGINLPTANDNFWDGSYAYIREINTMLEKAKEYSKPDEVKGSVAEGRFFRAYEYFGLVKRYGDVPYYDNPLTPSSKELYTGRTSRDTVIKKILADLDAAIPDLPLESETTGSDQGRITKGSAQSLKAIVALYEGTWAKYHHTGENVNDLLDQAINAANDVINSEEYALYYYTPDSALSYKMSYTIYGNDSKEQILARRYALNIAVHNWSGQALAGESDGTKKLADMYLCTDGLPIDQSPLFKRYGTMTSEYQNRDSRMSNTILVPGSGQISGNNINGNPVYPYLMTLNETGYAPNKFIDAYPEAFVHEDYDFWQVIKYSQVLLTLAEALYERNGKISDADLNRTINILRDRAGVAHLTNAFVTAYGLDMLQEIRRERTIELAWDGKRLDDLKRWNIAVKELDQSIMGVKVSSGSWDILYPDASTKLPTDSNGFVIIEPASNRHFSERNYLDPIPTQQIQLNPALKQNPGW